MCFSGFMCMNVYECMWCECVCLCVCEREKESERVRRREREKERVCVLSSQDPIEYLECLIPSEPENG